MKQRCYDTKNSHYHLYGGRGIKICNRWLEPKGFDNFMDDLGQRPSSNHSIDRINNDGDYSPENCRWSISKVQSRNKRNNINVTFKGETKCIADWIKETGLSYRTLKNRIKDDGTVGDDFDYKYSSKKLLITFEDKTQSLFDWSKELKIKLSVLYKRLSRGWSTEEAFEKVKR